MGIDLGYDETELRARGPKAYEIKEKLQQDYVRADVYYQTLNVQTLKQEEKYSVRPRTAV